jgi:hypothetical protein
MPRHKTRKALRGGALSHLNASEFGYTGIESMMKDMSFYAVSCHGQTTPDKRFIIVPPKTYIIFTAHSGDYAYSGIEEATTYLRYGPKESAYDYYKKMYQQLFYPKKQRNAPQLTEKLYIYEPGDIMPDYNLFFYNTTGFVFTHGLYSLPMESISGPHAKHHTDHWGNTKLIMKKLFNKGIITRDDFDGMAQLDKLDILTKSDKELEEGTVTHDAGAMRRSAAMKKIENLCCYQNPNNLLFKPPFDQELLQRQNNVLRLSYVLNTMPHQDETTQRVFFCHFCRVSFDDYLHEQKPLLRALSFSGKCPSSQDREVGFNIFRVSESFCRLSTNIKNILLKTEEGQLLINTLLKVKEIPPECFTPQFPKTMAQIRKHYKGALRMSDLINLLTMKKFVDKKIRQFDKKIKDLREMNTNDVESRRLLVLVPRMRRELLEFYSPISEFVDNYNYMINKHYNERNYRSKLMESIYNKVNSKLSTIKINRNLDEHRDPLHLETVPTVFLEEFDDDLDTDKRDRSFEKINREMRQYDDLEPAEKQQFFLIEFETEFPLMVGRAPIEKQYKYIPFSNKFPLINGINVNEDEPVNENENEENEENALVVTNEAGMGLGGGKRKARKTRKRRLISKK